MRVNDKSVYMGDNGATYCGKHLGVSAKTTGRDISGQPIMEITPEVAQESVREFGYVPSCETCGREPTMLEALHGR